MVEQYPGCSAGHCCLKLCWGPQQSFKQQYPAEQPGTLRALCTCLPEEQFERVTMRHDNQACFESKTRLSPTYKQLLLPAKHSTGLSGAGGSVILLLATHPTLNQ